MRIGIRAQFLATVLGKRQAVWLMALVFGWLSGPALGQIVVNAPGLHDANQVFGIDGSLYTAPWINAQSISVLAWGETDPNLYADVSFFAYGIYSDPNVANSAAIDVNAVGGNAFSSSMLATANFNVYGLFTNGDANNTGVIRAAATGGTADANDGYALVFKELYGIYAFGDIFNGGDIFVLGSGGTADSGTGMANASIRAYGLFSEAGVNNDSAVSVSATAGQATTNGTSAYAYAYSNAYGISAFDEVNNSGNVSVAATGGTAGTAGTSLGYAGANTDTEAYGINTYADIHNSGALNVAATGGTANSLGSSASSSALAYGIFGSIGAVYNTGNVTVSATGGTVDANDGSATATAAAYGIRGEGNVDNSGTLTVTATGGTIDSTNGDAGAEAYGIYAGNGDVTNSGAITVSTPTGSAFTSYATGIYMFGDGNLTNTGVIRTTGDDAYELYVASGTTTLLNTYNVTLDGDPNEASIYVANGGTLALNNAALTVTEVAGQTQWDTEYRLFETSGYGVVDGNFAEVGAINPNITATYFTQGTTNAADDTVSLSYAPQASEALASSAVEKQMISHAAYAINRHMTSIMLEDMFWDGADSEADPNSGGNETLGQSACQRASGMFVEPYYTRFDKDPSPLGCKAGLWGFSTGYTQCLDNTLLGLHVGYGKSDIDYTGTGYSSDTEDQGIVTGGFSGLVRWKPWTVRYGFTSFYGWHDYHGLTGLSLNETAAASYNSYGGTAALAVGRIFKRGRHVFFPEIGATWLWTHRDRYTTEATDTSFDTTYSALDDHDVLAEASLHWQSRYTYRKIRIVPSASIAIHNLLTDAETAAWQSIPNADAVQVKSHQDRTAVAVASSVVLRRLGASLTLAYDGEFTSDTQSHSAWMRYKWLF